MKILPELVGLEYHDAIITFVNQNVEKRNE